MARSELFFKPMAQELEQYGFKYVKSKNGFVKREKGNEYWFNYELWSPFQYIQSSIGVSIGEVEQLKKNAWGKGYNKFFTVGSPKSEFIEIPGDSVLKTDTDDKILVAIQEETRFFKETVLDYCKLNSDYMYVHKILNTNLGENLFYNYSPINTCMTAVAVAKLAKSKRLDEIYEYYRSVVLRCSHQVDWTKEYKMLVDYLKSI